MKEDVRLVLAIFFSIPIMFLLYPMLSLNWKILFPSSANIEGYAGRFASPVHIVLPIASAIFFFVLFSWAEKNSIINPRTPYTLLLMLIIVFLAYYAGIGGFYFFRYFDWRIIGTSYTYFLYVPYWTVLAGLISAWVFYVVPLPKIFKEK